MCARSFFPRFFVVVVACVNRTPPCAFLPGLTIIEAIIFFIIIMFLVHYFFSIFLSVFSVLSVNLHTLIYMLIVAGNYAGSAAFYA